MLTLSKIYAVKTKRPLVILDFRLGRIEICCDANVLPLIDLPLRRSLPAGRQAFVFLDSRHQQSVSLQIYRIFR